jgi:hypothetical protein
MLSGDFFAAGLAVGLIGGMLLMLFVEWLVER